MKILPDLLIVVYYFLTDSGSVPDLARLMIRDCRYDVCSLCFFRIEKYFLFAGFTLASLAH